MTAYKNFWSLNTDEAVVTGILREHTPKEIDVLMPINAQMKDIDLGLLLLCLSGYLDICCLLQ